tara:strand:- start:211 stop:462 length:252 start_codon:yes stop_codon:yes gene_type:complete
MNAIPVDGTVYREKFGQLENWWVNADGSLSGNVVNSKHVSNGAWVVTDRVTHRFGKCVYTDKYQYLLGFPMVLALPKPEWLQQ